MPSVEAAAQPISSDRISHSLKNIGVREPPENAESIGRRGTIWKAHELSPAGPVTATLLADVLERLQVDATSRLRAVS